MIDTTTTTNQYSEYSPSYQNDVSTIKNFLFDYQDDPLVRQVIDFESILLDDDHHRDEIRLLWESFLRHLINLHHEETTGSDVLDEIVWTPDDIPVVHPHRLSTLDLSESRIGQHITEEIIQSIHAILNNQGPAPFRGALPLTSSDENHGSSIDNQIKSSSARIVLPFFPLYPYLYLRANEPEINFQIMLHTSNHYQNERNTDDDCND